VPQTATSARRAAGQICPAGLYRHARWSGRPGSKRFSDREYPYRFAFAQTPFLSGVEADYFGSVPVLRSQLECYRSDVEARQRIAPAGAARVRKDGHGVLSRMRDQALHLRARHQEKAAGGLT